MARTPRHDYRSIRSILETPILDDHKWGKLPGIAADMVFLDLEDSVPPASKDEARDRAARSLRDREFEGTKLVLARPNHVSTPWGHDDIAALAKYRPDCVAYPKIRSAEDVHEVLELFRGHGADPDVFAIIETAQSVLELREIATVPGVVGLMSGPGDISAEAGLPLYEPDGSLNGVFHVTKTLTALAGVAYGLATTDIAYAANIRDLDEIRQRVRASRRMGFTAMSTFYPPHVDIINEEFTPGAEERRAARECVAAYERVLAGNRAAALTPGGEPILVHDYERARSLLARAER